VAILICTDSWKKIEEYAKDKEERLTTFLSLPNGIPSNDTIHRVMRTIY
jgi:hypothetical protein